MSESERLKEILAHERIWQSLNDKATKALDAFGVKDYRGRADYWIIDDDWGPDLLQVEVKNLRLLRRDAIGALKRVLDDYPGWQIAVQVFARENEPPLPPMGLLISNRRVFDDLKREYLPPEFRQLTYEDL
jgi:hypothetical protein